MAGKAGGEFNFRVPQMFGVSEQTQAGLQPQANEQYGFGKHGEEMYNWLLQSGGLLDTDALQKYRGAFSNYMGEAGRVASGIPVGFSAGQQQQIKAGVGASTAAPYRAAGAEVKNAAARTGSPTALAPALAGLARDRSIGNTEAMGQLPGLFHNAEVSDSVAKTGALAGVAGAYGAGQGRETSAAPLFQFPVTAGMGAYGNINQNILDSQGQRFSALNPIAGRANQPGLGARLLESVVSNAGKGVAGHYGG